MSLFGGSPLPSRSPHESDMSESSSTRSSPSVVETPDPHNAQEAQKVDVPVQLDVNADLETDTESEEDEPEKEEGEEDEEEPARPNRFGGEPTTWRTYTEADRQIVESLDQIQNSDLSAHLYNTHAMKRRLQRPAHELAQFRNWHSREAWLKPKKDLKYTDAAGIVQEEIVPPNEWTAWPLPPAELPNGSESLDDELESDQDNDWTLGNGTKQEESEELREELLAAFLRIAKDRWNMRDASSSVSDAESDSRNSRGQSRSKSVKSTPSRSTLHTTSRTKGYSDANEKATGSGTNEEQNSASRKRRGRKTRPDVFSKPVILADDARARQLLQPSIQSMMTKLDELALAIYRTRRNRRKIVNSGDSSMNDFTSEPESNGFASRSTSRAASRAVSRASSRASSKARSEKAMSRSTSIRPSSRASSVETTQALKQGIKDDDADAIDSDATHGDSSNWESVTETPRRRKRRRSNLSDTSSDYSTTQGGNLREASLDWSEVLGLAAVQGWDPGAIARTAQRCATLFGESMSFVPLPESMASKPIPKPVWYTPSTIPAPSILSATESPTPKRPLFQSGTLSCPHPDCEDYKRTFASASRVIKHCTSVHGYDPRTNDSENEARMAGGVHTDGFTQPITLKSRWLSTKKAKSKHKRKSKQGQKAAPSLS